MPDRPEPNGWELAAGIERIEKKIDEMAKGFVSAELFTTVVGNLQANDTEHKSRLDALETRIVQREDDLRKARSQLWTGVALSLLPVVAGYVFVWLSSGGHL